MNEQGGQTIFVNGLRVATVEIEAAAVGIFSLFEARMQHHTSSGPFFRQFWEQLIAAGKPDLADRLHHYYLAVNALKHGRGKSYEELLATPNLPFAIKKPEEVFSRRATSRSPRG